MPGVEQDQLRRGRAVPPAGSRGDGGPYQKQGGGCRECLPVAGCAEEPARVAPMQATGSAPVPPHAEGEQLLDWRELDAIQASELIRDMEALCAPQ